MLSPYYYCCYTSGKHIPRLSALSTRLFSSDDANHPKDVKTLLEDLYKDFDIKLQDPDVTSDSIPFKDDDAVTIYDIDEERAIRREKGTLPDDFKTKNEVQNTLMEKLYSEKAARSESGVFEVQELVTVLRKEKCRDVIVMDVKSLSPFFEHLVIVSCVSKRSMPGVSKYIRKLYKYKSPGDAGPLIEGAQGNAAWLAMDLGNIALHLFLPEKRLNMDLEALWGLGPGFDVKASDEEYFSSPLDGFFPRKT
uniref:C7orf30 n=1 Tax=Caligus rogercresseyi TaxID=217165 RepID=C1BPF5_CALRO|nr:C7orf30 [Caligus rogercresseyi]